MPAPASQIGDGSPGASTSADREHGAGRTVSDLPSLTACASGLEPDAPCETAECKRSAHSACAGTSQVTHAVCCLWSRLVCRMDVRSTGVHNNGYCLPWSRDGDLRGR